MNTTTIVTESSTSPRSLRGGCHCGRNRYIINVPEDGAQQARLLFNTDPYHQIPLATPVAAYIRVPLSWYRSTTYSFYPDETHAMIKRVYSHPTQDHTKRHFCGFCGTPLSYWSEEPPSEADFIQLTLGSLVREDIRDLDDLGLVDDGANDDDTATDRGDEKEETTKEQGTEEISEAAGTARHKTTPANAESVTRSVGVPWFDDLVDKKKLGKMYHAHGGNKSRDGTVKIEWEVFEYADYDDHAAESQDVDMEAGAQAGKEPEPETVATPGQLGKRKLCERDD